MPRLGRVRSETGVYHVMMRGNNKEVIFKDSEDKKKYIFVMFDVLSLTNAKIHTYCLMDNHVHILVEEADEEPIGTIIKRISVRYVHWYNRKYKRIGHLFQGRFKSEVVLDECYYKTVMRYIHQNPVKAGMVKKAEHYCWSSMGLIMESYLGKSVGVYTDLVKKFWPEKKSFVAFVGLETEVECLDIEKEKLDQEEQMSIIEQYCDIQGIKAMDKVTRNVLIKKVKLETGATNRELAVLLSLGRSTIERALNQNQSG